MDLMVIMVIADTQEGATVIIAATETPFPEKKFGGAASGVVLPD